MPVSDWPSTTDPASVPESSATDSESCQNSTAKLATVWSIIKHKSSVNVTNIQPWTYTQYSNIHVEAQKNENRPRILIYWEIYYSKFKPSILTKNKKKIHVLMLTLTMSCSS